MNRKQSGTETVAAQALEGGSQLEASRREFLAGLTGAAIVSALPGSNAMAREAAQALNIARVALPSSLTLASESKISALNSGVTPESSFDRSHGLFALHNDDSPQGV